MIRYVRHCKLKGCIEYIGIIFQPVMLCRNDFIVITMQMSTSSKQYVALIFRSVNSHTGMHILRQLWDCGEWLDLSNNIVDLQTFCIPWQQESLPSNQKIYTVIQLHCFNIVACQAHPVLRFIHVSVIAFCSCS